jgi:AcrR family transcriptional regulator
MTPTKTKGDDLRIRRTYKLLAEALYSLLEEKPFDDLSVIDICERAMIHRTTFYRHFEDKYHLMAFCTQKLTEKLAAASSAVRDGSNPRAYHLDVIRQVVHFYAEHKKMVLLLADRSRSNTVFNTVHEVISAASRKSLEEEKKKGVSFRVPIPVITEYYIGAIMSLTVWWLRNSMPYSEDELMHYIDMLTNIDGAMSANPIEPIDEPAG